jgi:23S rRNA (adenine2030-N6)-methyltransferase
VPPLYPGSPVITARLTRPQDRIVLCEKHPEEARRLADAIGRDRRVLVSPGDGFMRLAGLLPPQERRGLVLIDPPYEEAHEFRAILAALQGALKRWAGGVYAVWYPIKARRDVEWFSRRATELEAAKILRGEILLYGIERVDRLNGCGMLILNPPWRLDDEMRQFAAPLAHLFARDGDAHSRVEWLKSE